MSNYKLVPVEPTPEMLDAAIQDGICVDGKPVWKKDVIFQAKWKYQRMLEAAPAVEAEQQPDVSALVEALEGVVSEIERVTCLHENTHRGGVLWEICEDCGTKWADDRGGKPEFSWPDSVEKARTLIAAHRKGGGK